MTEEFNDTPRGRSSEEDSPEDVALVPTANKNPASVVKVRVYKHEAEGRFVKGEVEPDAGYEYIARRWGDGMYDFEALNARGNRLRSIAVNTNVGIDLGSAGKDAQQPPPQNSDAANLLEHQATQNAAQLDRMNAYTERAMQDSAARSKEFVGMVTTNTQSAMERDREFFAAQSGQQQQFAATMMQQMQQMHAMALQQMTTGFQQTMAMMEANHARAAEAQNPALLFGLFERGLSMGRDMDGPDEEPWVQAITQGVKGLTEVRQIGQLSTAQNAGIVKPVTGQPPAKGARSQGGGGLPPPVSKDELKEVLRLKALLGDNFLPLAKQLRAQAEGQVAGDLGEDEDEWDDEPEDDSQEAGQADLDEQGNEQPRPASEAVMERGGAVQRPPAAS